MDLQGHSQVQQRRKGMYTEQRQGEMSPAGEEPTQLVRRKIEELGQNGTQTTEELLRVRMCSYFLGMKNR